MKILHITPHYLPFLGGVEIAVHEICKQLVKFGFDIEVVCERERDAPEDEVIDGVRVRRVLFFEPVRLRHGIGKISPQMLFHVARSDADVIHAHSYGFFSTYTSLFSNKPSIITTHSDPTAKIYPMWDFFRKIPIKICDYVIVVTYKEKAHLIQRGVLPERILVIPNGIALPAPVGKDLGIHPMILCMARLDVATKGQDILLKAMKEIHKVFPEAKLVIAGDGPDYLFISKMAKELGLAKCTILTGALHGRDKWNYIASCDVMCIPSRMESFSITSLEAMALRRPIVATNVGAIPEVIGDAAILVPYDSPNLLAKALIQTLTDTEGAKKIAHRGFQRVKNFSLERIVPKYKALYETLSKV